jgi:hypothetical protein
LEGGRFRSGVPDAIARLGEGAGERGFARILADRDECSEQRVMRGAQRIVVCAVPSAADSATKTTLAENRCFII